MARVITLEGLSANSLPRRKSRCKKTITVYSPILGENVPVCAEDLQAGSAHAFPVVVPKKRSRGRPKGSTVKSGAKRPKVQSCKTPVWVKTKGGKELCRCSEKGNSQILPHSACGRKKATRKDPK